MIYLNLNETKSIVATLQERTQIFNPYYIWKLVDADTSETYIFSQDDTSPAPWVYNQFTFSSQPGATQGATAGVIPANQGAYKYTAYATPNHYSLDISTASIVETGIFQIIGSASSQSTFTQSVLIRPAFKNL
jgi:hypothetical protein